MSFIPYENYNLETPLSEKEVFRRLSENLAPKEIISSGFLKISATTKPYKGSISGNEFKINRIIHYRNSFLPVIKGRVTPVIHGCRIHITMRMAWFVILFVSVWLSGALFGAIMIGYATIRDHENFFLVFIPFIIPMLGYLLFTGGFKYESAKARKFLKELLEAEDTAL